MDQMLKSNRNKLRATKSAGRSRRSATVFKKARNARAKNSPKVISPERLPSKGTNQSPIEAVMPDAAPRTAAPTALELYLREVGRVKLLTPAEEIALAKRIKKGDAEAREHMIKANLRLVVKIARDYDGLGLPLLDLINEGNIGLMKGVERFNPAKGAKLSTYASLWIKQSIRRALSNQSKTIRLPDHVVDKVAHIRKAEIKLRELLGHDPGDEEIAEHLGLPVKRVKMNRLR